VRQLKGRLPYEQILYVGDTAHVPYGGRPLEEVRSFALAITDFLVAQGAKMVVMACNISSAVALQHARERHPGLPVVGVVEAGARAGVHAASNGKIGVLATPGAVASGAYPRAIQKISPQVQVLQQSCPDFVPLVEGGLAESPQARQAAERYLGSLKTQKVETVILGCTHYPYLLPLLRDIAGSEMLFVDPAHETAAEAQRYLEKHGLLRQRPQESDDCFYISGEVERFQKLGGRFLGYPLKEVRPCKWNYKSDGAEIERLTLEGVRSKNPLFSREASV